MDEKNDGGGDDDDDDDDDDHNGGATCTSTTVVPPPSPTPSSTSCHAQASISTRPEDPTWVGTDVYVSSVGRHGDGMPPLYPLAPCSLARALR